MIYVLNQDGSPLMPTTRHGWVRHQLRAGRARVLQTKPFTIQLTYEATSYTQPITLNVKSGYTSIGLSAQTEQAEVFSAEVALDPDVSERITSRQMYRTTRRGNKTRYRQPGHSETGKRAEQLAPSLQHKHDSHLRIIGQVEKILPITHKNIQTASFDIQQLKSPDVNGVGYQQGEQFSFENLREYVLFRDRGQCQNPDCKNKKLPLILHVHHLGFWKQDRSDRPGNLVTLCTDCHRPANHQPGGCLFGWEPTVKSFRAETFMTTIRRKLVTATGATEVFGFQTKRNRLTLGLPRTEANDAFAITGKAGQPRVPTIYYQQRRRNNRSLATFRDAKYLDTRTGKSATGQKLSSGRHTRNHNLNSEDLRQYRGHKTRKGVISRRKQRYPIQPGDVVIFKGQKQVVVGTHSYGKTVLLAGKIHAPAKQLQLYRYAKGIRSLLN